MDAGSRGQLGMLRGPNFPLHTDDNQYHDRRRVHPARLIVRRWCLRRLGSVDCTGAAGNAGAVGTAVAVAAFDFP